MPGEQLSREQQARLPTKGNHPMHQAVPTPQFPARGSHETCNVMAVLPFSGERVQAFIQFPKGLCLSRGLSPLALGGSLVCLACPDRAKETLSSGTLPKLPRPVLPSTCAWARQAAWVGRPRPRRHHPALPASAPSHIWPGVHRSCCVRAICWEAEAVFGLMCVPWWLFHGRSGVAGRWQ